MVKKVAILQSNYIPWKGYFDLINKVDEFVLYDDAQYTRRDWRNRNKIKTSNGLLWLTIPVEVKGKYLQKINEVKINNDKWATSHWNSIVHSYRSSPYFTEYKGIFEALYANASQENNLSELNTKFIFAINDILGIDTQIRSSSEFDLQGDSSHKLLSMCEEMGATTYLSGPAAKEYLKEDLFNSHGVSVEWMDYNDYPEYPQLYGAYEHNVSIIDVIFNVGAEARKYMKSFSE